MSIFIIKIIAILAMVLDHIKFAIPQTNNFITEYFGRMSYPLFAFVLVEGYLHTSNKKRYAIRLFIFAIISQIPFMLFRSLIGINEWKMLNIMFTLLLGFSVIYIYENFNNKIFANLLAILIAIFGAIIKVDYGWYGIGFIYLFYFFRNFKSAYLPSIICLSIFYYFSKYKMNMFKVDIYLQILFICLSLIPIYLYNGKKGRGMKYFFYCFYPVHLILLYLINFFIV
jgi:hypothetical protein